MLFSLGHGQRIIAPTEDGVESNVTTPGTKRLSEVAPGALTGTSSGGGLEAGLSGGDSQSFGFLFPDADGVTGDDEATVNALKALAAAMVEAEGDPAEANSTVAPVFTFLASSSTTISPPIPTVMRRSPVRSRK